MALPNGYRRLKCIRSTGTQYINLGFKPNQDTRFVIDFETFSVNGEQHIASARTNSSTPLLTLFFGTKGTYATRYGTATTVYVPDLSGAGRHTFDRNKNVLTVDGELLVSAEYETFTVGSELIVFARNDGTGINGYSVGAMYSGQHYDNGVLAGNYIPALRLSDNKPGLYDDVTGEFLTNAGTGEFEYDEITPTGSHRAMVDSVIWGIPSGRCMVDGVGYSIQKGRALEDGVGYDVTFGPSGVPAGDLAVGSSVYANVNGVRTEFLVVHQGIPSTSIYDASCDGTWLLTKNLYEKRNLNSSNTNNYAGLAIHSYLNGEFIGLFETIVEERIKQVKIPYSKGGGSTTVYKGSNGLSARFFLLAVKEAGASGSSYISDGAVLSYFLGSTNEMRKAYYADGTVSSWWLRTPENNAANAMSIVSQTGGFSSGYPSVATGIRPACIIHPETLIDPDTFDILG